MYIIIKDFYMLTFLRYISEAKLSASGKRAQYDADKYIKPFLEGQAGHKPLSHEIEGDVGHLRAGDRVTLHSHQIINGVHHVIVSKPGSSKKITIPTNKIKKPKSGRGGKSVYNDEHAVKNVWNHFVNNSPKALNNKGSMMDEIEKAKTDKNHPLHFDNQTNEGFSGKKKTDLHRDSYYEELKRAVHTVHGLANHPEIKNSINEKQQMRVSGASRGKLSSIWAKNGATNATSKADVIIGEGNKARNISLKKGDSQLMSAQPEEMTATYEHAVNEHMKVNTNFTEQHKEEVMGKIAQVHKHLHAMNGATPEEKENLRKKAQNIINGIHKEHPKLIDHFAHEASTGHGKFGRNQEGTARFLVTTTENGAHVHDTETNNKPIVPGAVPRVASPKGDGRPGNLKLDYRTKNL